MQGRRDARIFRRLGQFLVRDELALDDDAHGCVDGFDGVVDREDGPLGEAHEAGRGDLDGAVRGRAPHDLTAQHALAQVEGALVGDDRAIPQVEGFVVDEQADDLAVGDVDDRLPHLRVTVAGLRVRQRSFFEERVEVGAGQPGRVSLLKVAAHADVPVRQREQALGLGEVVLAQAHLAYLPRFDEQARPARHRASSTSSPRSVTTTSAPWASSASPWPTRSTPMTYPNDPARPASTPDRASSNTAA